MCKLSANALQMVLLEVLSANALQMVLLEVLSAKDEGQKLTADG
ncbi:MULTISPECIES: hypothetical protein [unclassified Moorena]|uniref:Uncharacterized protein n=1 Tax=Moorena producens 3L TaxID=489825 RepID=F4XTA2_9CYAN|nr:MULTISPECIES: hypothetical protein [unclassified Moorena]EGJ32277.1 hypothetical protein LYNGBM3L_26830 [Moorena producens 3L]